MIEKNLIDNGRILNLAAHDPQLWPQILSTWTQLVTREWENSNVPESPTAMNNFLEKFLGDSTRVLWESYKQKFPNSFQSDLQLGTNPYSFTNKITMLVLNAHPNVGQDLALQNGCHENSRAVTTKRLEECKKVSKWFFLLL